VQATKPLAGFEVTADGEGLVGHAGVVLLVELADRPGLPAALDRWMGREQPGRVLPWTWSAGRKPCCWTAPWPWPNPRPCGIGRGTSPAGSAGTPADSGCGCGAPGPGQPPSCAPPPGCGHCRCAANHAPRRPFTSPAGRVSRRARDATIDGRTASDRPHQPQRSTERHQRPLPSNDPRPTTNQPDDP
jgi:hypothetical protein